MKKLFFTLVASLLFAANSFAQNLFASIAALEHEGKLTTFTGVEALDQALKAAADGDIITLSAGLFNYSNYTVGKSITLRGAGIDVNDGKNYTVVANCFYLDYQTNPDISITLEGIDFQGGITVNYYNSDNLGSGQLNINKCIVYGCGANVKNVTINSSIIRTLDYLSASYVKVNNSVVYGNGYSNSGANYTYCIVDGFYGPATYEHCILGNIDLSSCMANHCVYVDTDRAYYPFTPTTMNTDITVVENWSDVFNFEGANDDFRMDDMDFLRKQNFESKVVTVPQVGIYGGLMPYSPVLALPSIKNITVAKQSDGEGKLSIDVEIED
jgi:hypothetical protein